MTLCYPRSYFRAFITSSIPNLFQLYSIKFHFRPIASSFIVPLFFPCLNVNFFQNVPFPCEFLYFYLFLHFFPPPISFPFLSLFHPIPLSQLQRHTYYIRTADRYSLTARLFEGEALTPHRIYTVFRISTLGHFAD